MIAPARRSTEFGLIALAGIIIASAYVLASLGQTSSIPANIGPLLIAILGLLAAAHVAMRRLAPGADSILLPVAGLLNGIGYVFIARLDPSLAGLQALWTAVGIGVFVATLAIVRRAQDVERYRYTFALLGILLLLMPLLPGIGRTVNGARLWIRLGPFTFQPGEFAKIALAIFFASYLVERRELLLPKGGVASVTARIGYLAPLLAAWGMSLVVMIAERDLGSSLLFFALFVVLLWVGTGWAGYLGIGGGLFAVGALFSYNAFAHVQSRVAVWRNPWPVSDGAGYQIVQSMFAFGAGGLAGTGLGLGSPQRIPAAETDLIFAAIGEELGLLGAGAVIMAYLLMVGTGIRIALRAERSFDQLLATGLTVILGLQTFIILGGVTRLLPLTGITLPFVSYGGSSLLSNYVLLALLLRISDQTRRGTAPVAPRKRVAA